MRNALFPPLGFLFLTYTGKEDESNQEGSATTWRSTKRACEDRCLFYPEKGKGKLTKFKTPGEKLAPALDWTGLPFIFAPHARGQILCGLQNGCPDELKTVGGDA
jgi:hypothetical protein